jgi:non-canonical poly(A) RNA polymerase PAPD5/7
LCLPWSDLDVVLVNKEETEANVKVLLNNLYEHIKTKPWVKEFKFLANASTPIIKLTCTEQYDSMSIDISIKDKTHFGLKCVELVKDLISKYESLKPLTLAIKNVLKRANLNDPYTGGISSYGLILMIVSFLQTQKNYGIDISINENNLGRLFHDFVEYYGLKFESKKYIISVKVNSEFTNNSLNSFNNSFNYPIVANNDLIIIDPLNIDNNVAKSCFQFFNIKMSFIICLITLKEDCECGCHYNGLGEEYNNLNTEHCFLKRMFNSVKRFQLP